MAEYVVTIDELIQPGKQVVERVGCSDVTDATASTARSSAGFGAPGGAQNIRSWHRDPRQIDYHTDGGLLPDHQCTYGSWIRWQDLRIWK